MNLVLDIGNTLCKLAIFNHKEMVELHEKKYFSITEIDDLVAQYEISRGIYSSVREDDETKMLTKHKFLVLSHITPLPLVNLYKTPATLGKDRIAGVVGARNLIEKGEILVIDMGTCVTYDILNTKNEYLGGAISPGFEMRLKALNTFTGKLPKVDYQNIKPPFIGDNTESSILSGVYNGLKNEIQATINQYVSQYSNLNIVLTGGDFELFDLEPKNRIFADKFLVLKGLNEILNYNAGK